MKNERKETKRRRWKIAVNKSFDLSHKTVLISRSALIPWNKLTLNTTPDYTTASSKISFHLWRDTGKLFPSIQHATSNATCVFGFSCFLKWRPCLCFLCLTFANCAPIQLRMNWKKKNASPIARTRRIFANCVFYMGSGCEIFDSLSLSLCSYSRRSVCVCVCRQQNWTMKFSHSSRSSVEIWSSRRTQRRTHVFRSNIYNTRIHFECLKIIT